MRTTWIAALAVVLSCLITAPASAQSAARGPHDTQPDADLERLRRALLYEVRVTDAAGYTRTGTLDSLDGNNLRMLTVEGPITVSVSTLRRIERRGDSLKNGIAIGAAAGVFGAAMAYREASIGSANGAAFMAFGVGVYALIGAGIDALHNGWTTISPPPRHPEHGDPSPPRAGSSSGPPR